MDRTVAVLAGGRSPEREVSQVSGKACFDALTRLGARAVMVDPAAPEWTSALTDAAPDCVVNALHGVWGEDGRVQGVLEYLGLPYSHSGVLASALAMDKARAKDVLARAGLDAPAGRLASAEAIAAGARIDPPSVVKPNAQGSSVGVFLIREGDNRSPGALAEAAQDLGDDWLIEEFIPGRELTVTVMHDRGALAVTEITSAAAFYNYDAKYAAGGSTHILPADLPDAITTRALAAAETAHAALGCKGVTRSDFRFDPDQDRLAILEVNTQPGMTPTSLAPEQAAHVGIGFDDLVRWMAEDASCPR